MIPNRAPRAPRAAPAPRTASAEPASASSVASSVASSEVPPAPRRRAWAAGTVVVALVLFTCYLRQSRTIAVGSDGASQVLQAWDMIHGNPLLRGWRLTDVSFYSTELVQYAALDLIRGLSPDVMHVGGAMTYTLLVLAAAFLARGRATGRAGLARALIAGGLMLAPQLGAGTQTLVLSPDHTGTGVPVLLCWLLIDRAPARWYVPVLVWLGLTLAALADALTLFVAVIPLALGCGFAIARDVAGNRARPRERGYELALGAAAVLAFPAELAAAALIRAAGGWQVNGLSTALAGAGRLAGNARLTGEGLLELFGADVFGAASTGSGLAVAFAVIHLAGAALAAVALAVAARRFFRAPGPGDGLTPGLIERLLVLGIVIDVAGYLAGVQAVNLSSTREIAPVLPFAAVLAGRLLGDRLLAGRLSGDRLPGDRLPGDRLPGDRLLAGRLPGGWLLGSRLGPGRTARPTGRTTRSGRAARYGLGGALALSVAMLGYAAAQPPAPPQYSGLAAWLPAHQLTAGLSGYHQANIVTLESGGAVILRPVTQSRGHLVAYTWNASTRWFAPAGRTATFLVLADPGGRGSAGGSGITYAQAIATFGRPARTYRYPGFRIVTWPRGENLLTRLS